MLSRITRVAVAFSPYVQKQRQFVRVQHQFVRLLSQSPALNVANQAEDSADLLFDLGGSRTKASARATQRRETSRTKKVKNPKEKVDEELIDKVDDKPPTLRALNKKKSLPKEKRDRSFEELKYHDLALNLTYVKLPFNHPELPRLMTMLKSRKYREKEKLLLIEGRRLILEAVEVGLNLRYLLFSNVKQIEMIRSNIQKAFTKETEIIRLPHHDLSFWSTLTTCPGLIAVFQKPNNMQEIWNQSLESKYLINGISNAQINGQSQPEGDQLQNEESTAEPSPQNESQPVKQLVNTIPITVICDQVREPNNLGGIIRTCAALPCTQVVLLKGCADPWDIKSLRGGCGAQFRIPIVDAVEWEDLTDYLPDLNELSVFVADNQTDEDTFAMPYDEFDHNRKENNIKFLKPKVYSDIPFHNCKHIALIIGGETEGVSGHAIDFMRFVSKENSKLEQGEQVRPDNAVVEIPLGNGVESLNANVAAAILLFEMRKQLTQ